MVNTFKFKSAACAYQVLHSTGTDTEFRRRGARGATPLVHFSTQVQQSVLSVTSIRI